jgi:hypothetical protein
MRLGDCQVIKNGSAPRGEPVPLAHEAGDEKGVCRGLADRRSGSADGDDFAIFLYRQAVERIASASTEFELRALLRPIVVFPRYFNMFSRAARSKWRESPIPCRADQAARSAGS